MSETKAAEPRTYTYEELAGHDVYELAHSGWTGEVYWSKDSLYLTDDDDGLPMLLPLFYEGPIPDFRWDAPNCISLYDWAEIRQEALDKDAACFERLFREIDAWLTEEDRQAGCFCRYRATARRSWNSFPVGSDGFFCILEGAGQSRTASSTPV